MIARFLDEADTFAFACRQTGDCCRQYTIVCTPYDLVRLRHATGQSTTAMLAAGVYDIVDESFDAVFGGESVGAVLSLFGVPTRDAFPVARLRKAVDACGPACPFLTGEGLCGVYEHRPGVCRSYPLGRVRTPDGPRWFEREYNCPGKGCGTQGVADWITASGLAVYADGNDRFADFVEDVRNAEVDFPGLPNNQQARLRTILYDFDHILNTGARDDGAVLAAIDEAAHAWLQRVTGCP